MTRQRTNALPRRILVIDDTESIHSDFEKVLSKTASSESEQALDELDRILFDDVEEPQDELQFHFEIDHAYQGQDGAKMVESALEADTPYSLAFVDMRMPPGWDGLKTIEEISKLDPYIQIVICSAFSDYSWREITDRIGRTDRLLILKKPFDHAEVSQLAVALSEKWQTEQKTRDLLEELEGKVEDRTKQLSDANENLNQANADLTVAAEEARSAERAKGRFLATMSHEIRTTLNGIIGASHMLNHSESLVPGDKEFAGIIQTSGDALMIIINDILDYSKYESGQLELEQAPFSLKDLARECVNLMDTSINKHNVAIDLELSQDLPELVIGDPSRIRQVILNLLNNATKFGRNGTVTLVISVESLKDEIASLQIAIQDEGIGMEPETIERLFSAFMQADSSTTREYGGTGLGLAICKLLADAMNGRIEAQSVLGKGSTFSFFIKLPVPDKETKGIEIKKTTTAAEESARVKKAVKTNFSSVRVLLVDDNAINRKLGKRFLKQMKIEVTLAVNGLEAYELATKETFDLILMDLQMPEMDGMSATKKIRESDSHQKDIPIIALTANAFHDIRIQCIAAGMNDFLTKPLRVNELSETIERVLANRSEPSV